MERSDLNRIIDLRNTRHIGSVPACASARRSSRVKEPLDSRAFAFLTLVNDEKQYATCTRYIDALQVPSGYTVEKVAVIGAVSMAEGYQRALEVSTARYKIYVHQDVYLVHRGLLSELLDLFRTYPRLGMIGVVGATRLPASAIWWLNNFLYSYGRVWEYYRPGGFPMSFLGPLNRRRLHFMRFRPFVGDYLPAVVVDGLFLATQYDIQWVNSLGGFELYDLVQAVEFIKAGLEVGIARQETIWLLNWGPLQERSREQIKRRDVDLFRRSAAFRQQNPACIGVPARKLLEQHRGSHAWVCTDTAEFSGIIPRGQEVPGNLNRPESGRERLGVMVSAFKGRDVLLRSLQALVPQCDALEGIECQVVVMDSGSADGTAEAVRLAFPQVTVLLDDAKDGIAAAFNAGLRHLAFPSYVLVMHDDAELSAGTLATMVNHLRKHPPLAGVIASFVGPDGAVQFQRTTIVELMPRRPRRPQLTTFIGTACALVRGEVFFDVGLYDERLPCQEDVDWSIRAKRKGYEFAYLPEARVIRHGSLESHRRQPGVVADRLLANLRLVYKHAGRRWATVLYWVQRLLLAWRAFQWRNDREALRQLNDAVVHMEVLYRKFREENRRPQLL